MTDVTKAGLVPGLNRLAEKSPVDVRAKKEEPVAARADTVEISQDALSRQDAEKTAAEIRRVLAEGRYSIGVDPEKAEQF
ncbi:MAG: hypothetical protein EOM26_02540 [Alphaproteobacteria bacterium]|nr:hypothetical protein [Alphaproteobacteria bacterium]